MAPRRMTDYERQRLENIRRNDEMMAALKLHTKASQLSDATKRQRHVTKSYKVSPEKKPKTEAPTVIRRSLRTRGIAPPDSKGLEEEPVESPSKTDKAPVKSMPALTLGPLTMRDAKNETGSYRELVESILRICKKSQSGGFDRLKLDPLKSENVEEIKENLNSTNSDAEEAGSHIKLEIDGNSSQMTKTESEEVKNCLKLEIDGNSLNIAKKEEEEVASCAKSGNDGSSWSSIKSDTDAKKSCFKLGSLALDPENIARVVPGRIMALRFFPCAHSRIIVVGNKFGEVGFWNANYEGEEGNGVYLYHPHSGPISGISIRQHSLSKVYTSCYDGLIRVLDAEKEVFNLVYHGDEAIYSLFQPATDVSCLYFAEGRGVLNVLDQRTGNRPTQLFLHEDRINSIDFSSENSNVMTTSSTDGTARIWDLRRIGVDKPKMLKMVSHERAVHSAYFSPSGSFLATTSYDDTVGVSSGANFEDVSFVSHNNQTSRWISSFRAIWGWDDSYVFIGNMKRGVDVISTAQKKIIHTLQSPYISAIPCRFDVNPCHIGMLAGGTSGGQVYLWSSS